MEAPYKALLGHRNNFETPGRLAKVAYSFGLPTNRDKWIDIGPKMYLTTKEQ